MGTPYCENDQRDRKPSAVAESVVRPNAHIIDNVVQTAKSRDHTADAGRHIFIAVDIHAGGVCCSRVLTDCTKLESHACASQHESSDQRDHDRQINEETVGKEDASEPTEVRRKRQTGFEQDLRLRKRKRGLTGTRKLCQRTAEKVTDADTEGRQRKTGHILVGTQSDREERVDQSHQKRSHQCATQRNEDRQRGVHHIHGVLVQECTCGTADTADIHDAGNTEVQMSRLFGDDLTGRTVEERRALHDRAGQKRDKRR